MTNTIIHRSLIIECCWTVERLLTGTSHAQAQSKEVFTMCRTFASIYVSKYPISNREISNLSKFYTSTRLQIVIEGLPKTKFCDLNTIPRILRDSANYHDTSSATTDYVIKAKLVTSSRDINFPLFEHFWQQKNDLLNISRNSVWDSQIKILWAIEIR